MTPMSCATEHLITQTRHSAALRHDHHLSLQGTSIVPMQNSPSSGSSKYGSPSDVSLQDTLCVGIEIATEICSDDPSPHWISSVERSFAISSSFGTTGSGGGPDDDGGTGG
ncbi:hypothetical protein PAXINDRAFT_101750 [Paxillus involutus ATCC 200175]|uniref:Uncharacterized protein n=1 Tax=Paxillus involutus ATCC 200175 TaxID=664439 RepID=A0A0C9TKM1_PAXIN|nr:hypothetical protein PAXINDRAFT_101750 [Paxillus involutus ATCC 200175]